MNTDVIENRDAQIYSGVNSTFVKLIENENTVRVIDVSDHSLRYAEDVVENWLTGVLN